MKLSPFSALWRPCFVALLGLTMMGCGQDDSETVRPLTLLFTGAVGGKIEPCG